MGITWRDETLFSLKCWIGSTRLAMVLISPASEIAVALNRERDISHHGHHIRLPIVEGLQGGEEHGVPLQQVRQLVQQLAAPGGVHRAPGAPKPERLAGRLDCDVDVSFIPLCYSGNHLGRVYLAHFAMMKWYSPLQ